MWSLPRITVCGQQGRWSVFVPGYGEIAIVADLWRAGGSTYCDPWMTTERLTSKKKREARNVKELVELIRKTGLVVTAEFDLGGGDPLDDTTVWARDEYCRLWRIADLEFDEAGLSFRFVEELADIGKKNKWQTPRHRVRKGIGSY
jgi:hypothetical protein